MMFCSTKSGCLPTFKSRRKKNEKCINKKQTSRREDHSAVLPEPESHGPSLQSAPPSFKTRVKPTQLVYRATNNRTRALSAPCSDALSSIELEEHDVKEHCTSNPQPLPLPSIRDASVLKNIKSFKSIGGSSSIFASGPLPLPPLSAGGLRNFSFEEVSTACQNFSVDRCISEGISSTVYSASFGDASTSSKKLDATVSRFLPSCQGLKEFVTEVNTLASLQHPQLCKLLGFHAREDSDQRMLVYERLHHGSLERLLHGRSEGPSIDWGSRMKVAKCAARGLVFLHEEGPFQAMYNEFSTVNIQVDKDFSAKLSGYGCVSYNPETDLSNSSSATVNLPMVTFEKGLLTPKSNVWSFGIVLLELLTGRKNLDTRHQKEERDIVKWSRPFLADDYRLSLIVDPRIKGRFPPTAARIVADTILKCLHKDPSERPTMRTILEVLASVQDIKYPCRYPLQEPSVVKGKHMIKSPSFSAIASHPTRMNFSPSPPMRLRQ